MIQIGAIFLWSYVYNTMRISSSKSSKEVEISDSSVIKSPRESYVSPPGSCTDPLLHSDKLEGFEDYPDQLALPSSRLEDIAQVNFALYAFSVECLTCKKKKKIILSNISPDSPPRNTMKFKGRISFKKGFRWIKKILVYKNKCLNHADYMH